MSNTDRSGDRHADAVGRDEHGPILGYGCRACQERLRHMMDCHGHSWESAHQSVQEADL